MDEVAGVLVAFEEASGLAVCIRTLGQGWRDERGEEVVPERWLQHRTAFCLAVKERDTPACMRCDVDELPRACTPGKGPFVRTCHAGADEVLVPLWLEGELAGVVMLGQFRRDAGGPGVLELPVAAEERVAAWRALALPLEAYLLDLLRRLELRRRLGVAGEGGRRIRIETFVERHLHEGVTLEALAGHLSLSPSRASHVVREVMGKAFREVVEERRVGRAKELLATTDGKLAWVAAQAGFRDPAYFCRYFRVKTGWTPAGFRREHRRAPLV